jgi:EAL domain-containing protein (putative c-di-GMP-specific phosphodiesterase class I)
MEGIRAEGCAFALDDFGAGLSSFSYLKALPVDYLKIDGAFVRDITTDELDCAIVESVNRIGHVVGLKTIAEFVETDWITRRLREIGADCAQGYALHRPEALRPPN